MSDEGTFASSSEKLTEAYRNWHIPGNIIINLKRVEQEFYWDYQPIKTQLLGCLIRSSIIESLYPGLWHSMCLLFSSECSVICYYKIINQHSHTSKQLILLPFSKNVKEALDILDIVNTMWWIWSVLKGRAGQLIIMILWQKNLVSFQVLSWTLSKVSLVTYFFLTLDKRY